MDVLHSFSTIAVAAACTFFWRILPFAVFGKNRKMPHKLEYLAKALPPTIMAVLIIYCLKDISYDLGGDVLQIAAVVVTAAAYKLTHSTSIGIIIGTAAYMALIRFF